MDVIAMNRCARPVAIVAALLIPWGAASAQDRWDWIVAPYVWAVDISTDLETPPPASAVITRRLNFGDVVDKLDGAFQMHAEGQGEHFGLFADFTYLGLSQDATRRFFQAESDLDTRLFEAAAVWSPGGQRFTGGEVFGGLRYLDLDIASTITPSGPLGVPQFRVDLDESFSDFMLGARYTWAFGGRWGLTLRGDGSWGDTDGTWNASIVANYRMKSGAWYFGYRYLDVDAEARGTSTDLVVKGPAVGYGFAF
ncbi:hypothetical protein ACHZ97_01705 [Lysobacter soli]|uniref:hypothetical protein n=1 Tax=Lysobacter soli TaxID=453783 RepID=UPI0037C6C545